VAGELDSPPPPEVTKAVERALAEGNTRYTPVVGTLELREAICEKFRTNNGNLVDNVYVFSIFSCMI